MSSNITRRLFDGALIILFAALSLYGAARLGLKPRDPAAGVGVVFAPWVTADAALTRSVAGGARFVRYGGAAFIVVVMPDAADYPQRMLDDGAVLVLDPKALAACLSVIGRGEAS